MSRDCEEGVALYHLKRPELTEIVILILVPSKPHEFCTVVLYLARQIIVRDINVRRVLVVPVNPKDETASDTVITSCGVTVSFV